MQQRVVLHSFMKLYEMNIDFILTHEVFSLKKNFSDMVVCILYVRLKTDQSTFIKENF